MSGGSGSPRRTNLLPDLEIGTLYGRAGFDVADGLTLVAEATFAKVGTNFQSSLNAQTGTSAYTIFADNAYLPTGLRATLASRGVTQFTLGRSDLDWGFVFVDTDTETLRLVGGLKADLGGGWRLEGYYQFGRSRTIVETRNNGIIQNIYNAADAVLNPANNQIVCRSTLLGLPQGQGCVPMNLFGEGAPSPQSIDYVTGVSRLDLINREHVVSVNLVGEPFSTWAGPVSFAVGGEYRKEESGQVVDPISASTKSSAGIRGFPSALNNSPGGFYLSNPQAIAGDFSVKEGYAEVNAPLAKDVAGIRSLEINGAVRYADYTTVGGVTTWKVGATYEPIDDIRFRVTRSRDIRAPNISELFTSAQQTIGQGVNDPNSNNARVLVARRTTGNANLDAEKADTFTVGAVLRPRLLPGFSFSVDYYRIEIDDVVAQVDLQAVLNGCAAGATDLCNLVLRNPDGSINTIITPFLNLARLTSKGIDFEANYATSLPFAGSDARLSIRLLATRLSELSILQNGVRTDRVGDLAITAPALPAGAPSWSGSLSVSLEDDRAGLFFQQRYIGGGDIDKTQNFNAASMTKVPAIWYSDLTATYKLSPLRTESELFVTVNNLFDRDPPVAPGGAATTPRVSNGTLYDFIGRYVTAGVRVKF